MHTSITRVRNFTKSRSSRRRIIALCCSTIGPTSLLDTVNHIPEGRTNLHTRANIVYIPACSGFDIIYSTAGQKAEPFFQALASLSLSPHRSRERALSLSAPSRHVSTTSTYKTNLADGPESPTRQFFGNLSTGLASFYEAARDTMVKSPSRGTTPMPEHPTVGQGNMSPARAACTANAANTKVARGSSSTVCIVDTGPLLA